MHFPPMPKYHQETMAMENHLTHLPGLVNIQKASKSELENGPVEIVDLPIKNGDFP